MRVENPKYHIKKWLDEIGIKKYTIQDNFVVDVEDHVDLSNRNLTRIPVRFGKVSGYFNFNYNQFTTLEGATKEVGGSFYCDEYLQKEKLEI